MAQPLKFETLNGGGVIETVDDVIQQVLDNIRDPNTEPKKPREVVIKLRFKPNEHRNMGDVHATVSAKLQPQAPQVVSIFIDDDGKNAAASEMYPGENPDQGTLPDVDPHNVSQLRKTGEG